MPLVTRALGGGRQVVVGADRAALSLGLAPSLPLPEARARVPDLRVHEADPAGDAAALRDLAAWASRYAPLVAPDPPDGLLLDVTGSTHLHGGEAALLDDLLGRLNRSGLMVRAAMAGTIGTAHAIARFGPADREVVAPGEEAARLAALSPAALRIAPDIARGLLVLGFETVGQLMAVPRAPLARRFGPGLLARLDAALGRRSEPLEPWFAPEAIQHRLAFVEPLLTATALGIALDRLLSTVCPALEAVGMGARTVDVLFERVDATVQAVRVGTARPSRDPGHLGRMLRDWLERVEPGFGIEAVRLVVRVAEPLAWSQTKAVPGEAPISDISALVDRLGNWLGGDRVFRAMPVESWVPERSFRRAPPLWSDPNLSWPEALPRPVRLITPPQPIEAIAALPDRPPAAFTWRRVRRRVRHADGPERITGEWWRREAETHAVRDYWAVEDEEGRRYWLFRRGDGEDPATGDLRWFLHGLF
ncbi:Y-family DNA polymerase [Roseomonas xinghualingensis]|uniref:Y-family DNA polymerase n=1 Tax=Roseomonas xinghualingensis TaxID=2986475 RepID=UPI0021F0D40B|nr:DNA polymerase Y family protein [Roseomonas sp. SXEYE001]MCV4210262.1 DNA polymerase Y family protein [Roseomonas sp. SXEYE001]